jgi:hypothetical protein
MLAIVLIASFIAGASAAECDPIVPDYCMLPFPNDFWRSNTTGQLTFTNNTFPVAHEGSKIIDPDAGGWNKLDGFSPLPPIMTYFKGLDDATFHSLPFPRVWSVGSSMSENSTSVLLNTVTGARVAHWAELDHSSDGSPLAGEWFEAHKNDSDLYKYSLLSPHFLHSDPTLQICTSVL